MTRVFTLLNPELAIVTKDCDCNPQVWIFQNYFSQNERNPYGQTRAIVQREFVATLTRMHHVNRFSNSGSTKSVADGVIVKRR